MLTAENGTNYPLFCPSCPPGGRGSNDGVSATTFSYALSNPNCAGVREIATLWGTRIPRAFSFPRGDEQLGSSSLEPLVPTAGR